jgi:hypothetical protein
MKTLKDINMEGDTLPTYPDGTLVNGACSFEDLKNLAREWIEELDKVIIYPYGKDVPIVDDPNKLSKLISSREFIKVFFNLEDKQ